MLGQFCPLPRNKGLIGRFAPMEYMYLFLIFLPTKKFGKPFVHNAYAESIHIHEKYYRKGQLSIYKSRWKVFTFFLLNSWYFWPSNYSIGVNLGPHGVPYHEKIQFKNLKLQSLSVIDIELKIMYLYFFSLRFNRYFYER